LPQEKSISVDVSVVVPVYNERESLPELMSGIAATLDKREKSYEAVFVDDGSSDGSFDELRSLHARYGGRVKAIRFNRNCGKSAALSAGIAEAGGGGNRYDGRRPSGRPGGHPRNARET
jgi:glycosyltransferase involved in cell wall biosynthesis